MEEVWKDIEGFPEYRISSLGRVKNLKTNKLLKPGLGGAGYLTVVLYRNKKRTTKNVHELVTNSFIGHKTKDMVVNHKDGNKTNNTLSNLELVTYSDNLRHAYRNKLNPHQKPIRIIETGEIFNNQAECARAIGGDPADVSYCLSGKLKSHKGLHFERILSETSEKKHKPFLFDHQRDAVEKMFNGCILNGGVGSGKSRTGLYYYFTKCGGSINPDYVAMENLKDLYIITTAMKRDKLEWEEELCPFLISKDPLVSLYGDNMEVVIDSWNNIGKYKDVKNAFFIFDEDRVTGSGVWVKHFLNIAKHNEWIILSATAGDKWEDYIPVFVANKFYRNRTEFKREHIIYSQFTKYPKIDRYIGTGRLIRLRNKILIDMDFERHTVPHHEDVYASYDTTKYKDAMKRRWDPFKNEPIVNAAGLCYVLRRIVNTDESRQIALLEILEDHPRTIVFYNFDHELELLKDLAYSQALEVAEWNGHAHQPIPDSDRWVYLVQYTAGCEGWNSIKTDTIVFYSQNYSYKIMTQAAGRIDRLNTPYTDLYYYHLKSRSGIDLAISKALKEKKKFNESRWVKW